MQISSVNNYTDLFQDIANSQAKEIKKAVIMEELNSKMAMASLVSDSILGGGYEMDSVIPEDSTVSYHV